MLTAPAPGDHATWLNPTLSRLLPSQSSSVRPPSRQRTSLPGDVCYSLQEHVVLPRGEPRCYRVSVSGSTGHLRAVSGRGPHRIKVSGGGTVQWPSVHVLELNCLGPNTVGPGHVGVGGPGAGRTRSLRRCLRHTLGAQCVSRGDSAVGQRHMLHVR